MCTGKRLNSARRDWKRQRIFLRQFLLCIGFSTISSIASINYESSRQVNCRDTSLSGKGLFLCHCSVAWRLCQRDSPSIKDLHEKIYASFTKKGDKPVSQAVKKHEELARSANSAIEYLKFIQYVCQTFF